MNIVLKPKSTSVVPEYTSRITTRIYPVIRDGKLAQLKLQYKLYFRNGELYALENSHRCGIDHNTDCWDFFNKRCNNLSKLKVYDSSLQNQSYN